MSVKEWRILYDRKKDESLWSALLQARKIKNPGEFFGSCTLDDLHDPFLFEDMQKSVQRIKSAIKNEERIWIYGDYDVDGTSGAALLVHTLNSLGAKVSYRVPHRLNEGYGLHNSYIDEAAKNEIKIIITVDCGISCKNEIDHAESLGIKVIITDHHAIPKELPNAFAILHPLLSSYPFKFLSGSGVAFKLASALLNNPNEILKLTDLASLGTVADMVPLIGENRTIVKLGLAQMQKSHWDGLRAILKNSASEFYTTETIGFQIGPRINAAGRMDNPLWAIQTLLAVGEDALKKAQKLESLNRDRQKLSTDIFEQALLKINHNETIIITEGEGWSSGLVGLIAGKIQEKFNKPTLILDDRGDYLIGSARSVKGFNIVEAIRQAHDHLEHYGGHEQAAGFKLKKQNYETFKKLISEFTNDYFSKNPHRSILEVDTQLKKDDLNLENLKKIDTFAPFGIANKEPLFLLENTRILTLRHVGKQNEHLKFCLDFEGQMLDGIGFRFAERAENFLKSNRVLANLKKNSWNFKDSVELNLVDFA